MMKRVLSHARVYQTPNILKKNTFIQSSLFPPSIQTRPAAFTRLLSSFRSYSTTTAPFKSFFFSSLFTSSSSSFTSPHSHSQSRTYSFFDRQFHTNRSQWLPHRHADTIFSHPDDFEKIFLNNKKFVERRLSEDPNYFKNLAKGQSPKYLYIGCSDARVSAQELTGLHTGELFVHRNVANLVVSTDMNLLSVLEFSIEHLQVKDIMVMGHYGCGGVEAALNTDVRDRGLIENWLSNIRDVYRYHQEELDQIGDRQKRLMRLVELNVLEQCLNLYKNNIVQRNQQKSGYPRIHGLVYNIGDGLLKELAVNFRDEIRPLRDIYKLYPFTPADFTKK